MTRTFALAAGLLITTVTSAVAQTEEGPPPLDSLRRATPSGQYINPASFFRFHGYTTISFTQNGRGVGQEVGATPQILVNGRSPRTGENESGFRNDAALFVGGEPFDGVGTVIEIHFVGNALNPVLTEAKFTYDLVSSERHEMILSGGRFWWPFGIHNGEWFSSVNNFPLLSPAAAEVVPAHYNELGFMVEGAASLGARWGMNYVGAIGNGVPGFELMPNVMSTASDADSDRTLTGRLALAHVGSMGVEVGLSGAAGGLREGMDVSIPADDATRYDASFSALGGDLSLRWRALDVSGYYYRSEEKLMGAPVDELVRSGFTLESSLLFPVAGNPRLQGVSLHARAGRADEDTMAGTVFRRIQLAGALTLHLTRAFQAEFAYVVQSERLAAPTLSNNVFSLSFTAEF